MKWLEESPLEFGTDAGPAWPAAKYLAVCAWPENLPQRSRLVEALYHAYGRAAGFGPSGPDLRAINRRVNRGTDRLEKAFRAAEIAQLKSLPPEIQFGSNAASHLAPCNVLNNPPKPLNLALPSSRATGPSGRPSIKRMQALAASGWNKSADPYDIAEGDRDFRRNVWRRFLPALPYIIPLKLYIQSLSSNPDLVQLLLDTGWLDDALKSSEQWAVTLSEFVDGDFIRLIRA